MLEYNSLHILRDHCMTGQKVYGLLFFFMIFLKICFIQEFCVNFVLKLQIIYAMFTLSSANN